MAIYTSEQAKEILKAPKNKVEIENAIKHEERLFLHTQSVLEAGKLPYNSYNDFISWVSTFLDKDKVPTFRKMMRLPLPTVDLSESIFDQLKKFLSAKDKFVKVEFTAPEYLDQFNEHLESLDHDEFMETKGFESIKSNINSLIVIDLPEVQTTPRPAPYYYLLSMDKVVDLKRDPLSQWVEYCAFKDHTGRYVFIDKASYIVFEKSEKTGEYEFIKQEIHSYYSETGQLISGIGYTPVYPFYDEPVSKSEGINQRSPITNSLAKFDWLLFWDTSKRYFDSYGAWPIVVSYKSDCTYRDEDGNACEGGYVTRTTFDAAQVPESKTMPCPVCSTNNIIGPGSFWEVDAPRDKDEADILQKPINIVEISNDKLEWVKSESERLKQEIFHDCVGGYSSNILNEKQINEDQVRSQFESEQSILDDIRKHFDKSEKFILETMARIMFGENFIRCSVFGGNEYFLKSVEELNVEYNEAKRNGLPQYEIANIRRKIIATRNRNNPDELERANILQHLEPYSDYSVQELKNLGIQEADPLNFVLKLNFNNFIERFERENTNILEFASLIPFERKISIIQAKLNEYANEKVSAIPQPNPERTPGSSAQ